MENYKKQCADQLEESKKHKSVQRRIEEAEENQPPSGKDLMYHIY